MCLKVAKPTFCTKASESLLEVWLDLVARLLRNTLMASKESPEKWSKVCQVVNPRTRRLTLQRHQEVKLAHSMKVAEPQLLSNQVVAEPQQLSNQVAAPPQQLLVEALDPKHLCLEVKRQDLEVAKS